jgi:hypothetical protein
MFKRVFTAGLTAAAAAALVTVPATSAEARAGCVTHPEYRNIGHRPFGMSRTRVTQIFDTRGRIYEQYGPRRSHDIFVRYPACNGHSFVTINFDNYIHAGNHMRLYKKDWHWNF